MRRARSTWISIALLISTSTSILTSAAEKSALDPWWTNAGVVRISILLSAEAISSLAKDPRQNVTGTMREGAIAYEGVKIHLKGSVGSFRAIDDKPGFTVSFAKSDADRLFHGTSKIHLNNSVEDPTYLNEKLGTILFEKAGIPATELRHALVDLNGKLLGLYVLKEGFTREFLARHFTDPSGTLYDQESVALDNGGAGQGSEAEDVPNLAKLSAISDPHERWSRAGQLVEMDEFISFMATEVMVCHRDGYCLARNNYRLYHNPATDRLVFLPHGMDQLFGRPDFPWHPHMAGSVAQITLAEPGGNRNYRNRLANLTSNVFDVPFLLGEVNEVAAMIKSAVPHEEKSSFETGLADLRTRIMRRKAFLLYELNRPEPRLLSFTNNVALLTNWNASDPPVGGRMLELSAPDGRPGLYVQAGALTAASWRTKILLPRGSYRFEGRAQVKGVLPLAYGIHHGARLRVAGQKGENGLVGDHSWTEMSTDFTIEGEREEVELLCEARARRGEVWFDKSTLRLLRNSSVTNGVEPVK
jgi:spore coat protein H